MIAVVRLADTAPQPWRNGGGTTRELLAWPTADDWVVRVSVAEILADGAFSAYPGVDRWFAVLDGGAVELAFADGTRRRTDRAGPVLAFDGAEAPHARLVDGPTRDLNLMVRRAAGRGALRDADRCGDDAPPWRALYTTVAGRLDPGDGGAPIALPAQSLAWTERARGAWSWRPDGGAGRRWLAAVAGVAVAAAADR